jgi:hypothetical protein
MGALLIVPLLASMAVILEYLRRRVLGLPPFGDDVSRQFVAPEESIRRPRRLPVQNQEKRNKES